MKNKIVKIAGIALCSSVLAASVSYGGEEMPEIAVDNNTPYKYTYELYYSGSDCNQSMSSDGDVKKYKETIILNSGNTRTENYGFMVEFKTQGPGPNKFTIGNSLAAVEGGNSCETAHVWMPKKDGTYSDNCPNGYENETASSTASHLQIFQGEYGVESVGKITYTLECASGTCSSAKNCSCDTVVVTAENSNPCG